MERLLTTEEVAEYLRVEVVTIRRLINRNDLAAYRIGGEYRFTESDISDFLMRQRVPASPLAGTMEAGPLSGLMQKVFQGKQISPGAIDRFSRFTELARRVLQLSQEAASRLQHNYIGTEHLLLGLIDLGEGIAIQALQNLNVDVRRVPEAIEAITGRGDRVVSGDVGLTPRAKKAIELAVDEARRLNHHYIGTEHLLLGLLREGEGIAADVVERMGVNLENARTEVQHILSLHPEGDMAVLAVPPEAASLLGEGEESQTCSRCSAQSPQYFRYCFNCGQALGRTAEPKMG